MGGYWIKALEEWAPDEPQHSCPEIDHAIADLERIRDVNEDLRKALGEAIEIIQHLDYMVTNLKAELEEKEEG